MVGLKPHQRRKTKVMVIKGQAQVRPKMFIQEAKNAVHVWRRIGKGKTSHIVPQKIPSLFSLTNRRQIASKVRADAGEYFSARFLHHLKFAAGKASKPK